MTTQDDVQRTLDAEVQQVRSPLPDYSKVKLTGAARRYALMRSIKQFSLHNGTDLSALMTYFAVLSLAPAALAVFSILTLVLSSNAEAVQNMVDDVVTAAVPEDYQALVVNLVETMTESASTGGVIALIIGAGTAIWSASAYIKAFSRNMNRIYGVVEGRSVVSSTLTMLTLTVALLVTVVVVLVSLALNQTMIDGLLEPIADPLGAEGLLMFMSESFLPIWAWAKWPVVIILMMLMITALYHFAPNVERPKFRWISTGSVFTLFGLGVAGLAMVIYLTYFASYSSYGMIGAVMALLFVMWVFNIVILIGAEIDAETERARQLAAGIPAEAEIQLPPRSITAALKVEEKEAKLIEDGAILRRSMAGMNEGRVEPAEPADSKDQTER